MRPTKPLPPGVALPFLLASLTGCVSNPTEPTTRTETVETSTPAYVTLSPELTAEVPEPKLPADAVNDDAAEFIAQLKAALRQANSQLRKIRELQK